jgi:putative oxidoreductase
MSTFTGAAGRMLIALIFIVAGLAKLGDLAGTNTAIVAVGMPSGLALPAALFEAGAGILLALGVFQRIVSLALIAFTALTTVLFHNNFSDPAQATMALKNLAIIGGLLLVFAHGYMAWGFNAYRQAHASDRAAREAEARVHAAELRAARAEGTAAGTTVVTDTNADGVTEVGKRRWWS